MLISRLKSLTEWQVPRAIKFYSKQARLRADARGETAGATTSATAVGAATATAAGATAAAGGSAAASGAAGNGSGAAEDGASSSEVEASGAAVVGSAGSGSGSGSGSGGQGQAQSQAQSQSGEDDQRMDTDDGDGGDERRGAGSDMGDVANPADWTPLRARQVNDVHIESLKDLRLLVKTLFQGFKTAVLGINLCNNHVVIPPQNTPAAPLITPPVSSAPATSAATPGTPGTTAGSAGIIIFFVYYFIIFIVAAVLQLLHNCSSKLRSEEICGSCCVDAVIVAVVRGNDICKNTFGNHFG